MPMDHNQGRRGHFHRGRRGPDRRGPERRQGPPPDQGNRPERTDRVDVEQIMRDIRARIAQRSGIELSNQQIQELAARRLEAILDPRGLKPELLDQLRRNAGERSVSAADVVTPGSAQSYPFDEATLYDSPNALLRFIRKLLRPLLRMLFNPTPIAHALALQSRLNAEIAARETERDRRQAEWNALHYEILQRLALEVSRGSIDSQDLLLRVESLAAKVDFNERRVRSMEGAQVRVRPQEPVQSVQPVASVPPEGAGASPQVGATQPAETPRRRRRRRRGRRGPGVTVAPEASTSAPLAPGAVVEQDDAEMEEEFEDEAAPESLDAIETGAMSEPIAETPPMTSSELITPSESMPASAPMAPPEPITSEPMTSPEPPPAAEPIAPAVSHEQPLSPAEPDHQDGQVNE